ncbi:hypothetical protein CASFOL_019516 [Castilleja foliolosa]|uniref:F-box domain-containing protein n=1 Tax=Castilleja foliolosa TaxID=1961234 RepID=A0ABD3D8Z0_9LAMI
MISELPQPILHHILSLLSEKCAARTSVLSKRWLHIWSTGPKIKLCISDVAWKNELIFSALDNLFQRYHDQNHSIHELCLEMEFESESVSVLNKWIPIVKVFNLNLSLKHSYYDCHIPLSVLVAASIKNLYMEGCMLSHQDIVEFKHLQTLHLDSVIIKYEAFEKMVSSCPRLKSLILAYIKLCNDSVNFSSNHMPCLEYLELHRCYGFTEFHLLSHSIKHLIIDNHFKDPVEMATIDVSSILYFKYKSSCVPSISFTTTNDHEWKSEIHMSFNSDLYSSWFVKLNKLLSALSHSEISLMLCTLNRKKFEDKLLPQDDDDTRPVLVENLKLCLPSSWFLRPFIHDLLFRVCHPRNISFYKGWECVLYAILVTEREATGHCLWQATGHCLWQATGHCLWRRDLEEVIVEGFDESGKRRQWRRLVQGTSLADHNNLCFRLKWREI